MPTKPLPMSSDSGNLLDTLLSMRAQERMIGRRMQEAQALQQSQQLKQDADTARAIDALNSFFASGGTGAESNLIAGLRGYGGLGGLGSETDIGRTTARALEILPFLQKGAESSGAVTAYQQPGYQDTLNKSIYNEAVKRGAIDMAKPSLLPTMPFGEAEITEAFTRQKQITDPLTGLPKTVEEYVPSELRRSGITSDELSRALDETKSYRRDFGLQPSDRSGGAGLFGIGTLLAPSGVSGLGVSPNAVPATDIPAQTRFDSPEVAKPAPQYGRNQTEAELQTLIMRGEELDRASMVPSLQGLLRYLGDITDINPIARKKRMEEEARIRRMADKARTLMEFNRAQRGGY